MQDNFSVENKIILICGGSGQLGSSLIKFLLKKKAKVINLDLYDLHTTDTNYYFFNTDITKEKKVIKIINVIEKKFKRINALINLTHYKGSQKLKPFNSFFNEFHNYSLKIWKKTLDINLNGLFIITKEVIKIMVKSKQGVIVNISSTYGINSPDKYIYGKSGINNPIAYATTKAAIINFTKYIATHYADKNIRANTLSPGGIENQNQSEEFKKNYSNRTPMRRLAHKEEFNESILYLISDASSYMTGSNLIVDGGWTAW